MPNDLELSVVVPLYNEQDNILPLYQAISNALIKIPHELVFVDDGSIDNTVNEVLNLKAKNIKLIKFTRNFGQTSAMAAGIEQATGLYIVTLDGDLQNDPNDIPMMLTKLKKEKLDLVAGRRKNRQDGLILRKIPSKICNYLLKKITKVSINDYGCTLKLFKSKVAKNLELYGELHRFIPILALMRGAKIAEMDVKHHARKFGVSKYGIFKTVRVISDISLMIFFLRYRNKPMHFFGSIGQILFVLGGGILTYLFITKIFGGDIGGRPLFFVGLLFITASLQFLTIGFIAELLVRTFYAAGRSKPYDIEFITSTDNKSDDKRETL